jgi:hypothetical protein
MNNSFIYLFNKYLLSGRPGIVMDTVIPALMRLRKEEVRG